MNLLIWGLLKLLRQRSENMNTNIEIHDKCPNCDKVNIHQWAKIIVLHSGFFVVKCDCGCTYHQTL